MNTATPWPEEAVETLKQCHGLGMSAGEIRIALWNIGFQYSRNAVIGKKKRLEAAGVIHAHSHHIQRSPLQIAHTEKQKAEAAERLAARVLIIPPTKKRKPRQDLAEPEDAVLLEDGSMITTMTINDRMCHWPIGDPHDADFHYCGRANFLTFLYCEAHMAKAHTPSAYQKKVAEALDGSGIKQIAAE